jgi:protein TonB
MPMMHAYPICFDRPAVDGERRMRRVVASGIVALHVLLLLSLLLSPQGQRALDTASRLVVVRLGDAPAHPLVKHAAPPKTNEHTASDSPQARAANPAGALVHSSLSAVVQAAAKKLAASAAAAPTTPDAGGVGTPASRGERVAGFYAHFRAPRTLHSWLPPYPEDAFRGNHQGTVDLLVTIAANGRLIAAQIDHSSGNASLDRAALESLVRYTFKAAERDGVPVRADAIVTINWIITQAIVQQFSSPRIERIDPSNLSHQRVQTQYGSYLKAPQRERDNDPDDRH